MPDTLVTAIVALVSAIGGGLLQAWFARQSERAAFLRQIKRETYQRFLNAMGVLSTYPVGSPEHTNAKSVLSETRAAIALIGSRAVVRTLGHALSNHVVFSDHPSYSAFKDVIAAMRRDSLGSLEPDIDADIIAVLFGVPASKPGLE